jgi:pimeloyl-ACP methyl ester carboxylesterase
VREDSVDVVGGGRLFIRRLGERGRPSILYWHGGGGANEEITLPQRLAARGPLATNDHRPSSLAKVAAALIDALQVRPVIWVGSSWGGTVGVHTATGFPARVKALVLLDAVYLEAQDRTDYDASLNLERRITQLRARSERGERWDASPEFIATVMHASDQDPCLPHLAALGVSRVPVLLVRATEPPESEPARLRGVERLRAAIPEADVVAVPSADHFLARGMPRVVEQIVVDWLDRRALPDPVSPN